MRREVEVAAHNIANVDTNAFKGERVIFQEYISAPSFRERHSFVDDLGTARDTSKGGFKSTGNQFDLALADEHNFFVIETPMGPRYTRNGRFQLDAERTLVTQQGYPVMGDGDQITIPPAATRLTIAGDGTINDDANFGVTIDTLQIVRIDDPDMLKRAANSLYIADPDFDPPEAETPAVVQGMLESSNVKAITELTRMMELNRMYTAVNKFVEKEDERIKRMIDKLATPPSG